MILFFSVGGERAHADTPSLAQKSAAAPKKALPVYFAGVDSFVVSLPVDQDGNPHYAELSISFSTNAPDAVNDFNAMLPIIKSRLMAITLANQDALQNDHGAVAGALTSAALPMVNQIVAAQDPKLGSNPFIGAYLTNLVLQ